MHDGTLAHLENCHGGACPSELGSFSILRFWNTLIPHGSEGLHLFVAYLAAECQVYTEPHLPHERQEATSKVLSPEYFAHGSILLSSMSSII